MLQQMKQKSFVHLTAKALRVDELLRDGLKFNEAFAIADREYTEDGEQLTPVGETLGKFRVQA